MKINSLVNAIARQSWLISPEFFSANAFMVAQIMSGKLVTDDSEPPQILAYNNNVLTAMSSWHLRDLNSPDTILRIPIYGGMMKHEGPCNYGMTNVENLLFAAAANDNIVGVVLDIDSGGGEAGAVPPALAGINAFKAAGKPIVAYCDVACSAAYWTAAATDRIFAANDITATFGSIGAMTQFVDIIPYLESLGYKVHTIYPPESSEKNKAFMLALEGKYEQITSEILSPLAQKFIDSIKALRSFSVDDNHIVFKGATFRANEALSINLIDQIGSFEDALDLFQ
jgi:protease IV